MMLAGPSFHEGSYSLAWASSCRLDRRQDVTVQQRVRSRGNPRVQWLSGAQRRAGFACCCSAWTVKRSQLAQKLTRSLGGRFATVPTQQALQTRAGIDELRPIRLRRSYRYSALSCAFGLASSCGLICCQA